MGNTNMSDIEHSYLVAMNDAASGYRKTVSGIYRSLRGIFIYRDYDPKVVELKELVLDNLNLGKSMNHWAKNNKRLNYFPSNSADIRSAKLLSEQARDGAQRMTYEYRNFRRFTDHLDSCADLLENIQKSSEHNDRLYIMLSQIEDAMAVDDSIVYPGLLAPLPR